MTDREFQHLSNFVKRVIGAGVGWKWGRIGSVNKITNWSQLEWVWENV